MPAPGSTIRARRAARTVEVTERSGALVAKTSITTQATWHLVDPTGRPWCKISPSAWSAMHPLTTVNAERVCRECLGRSPRNLQEVLATIELALHDTM